MRIKVGDQWHQVEPGKAIMVELTGADRRNIANMADGCTKYAVFDDADQRSADHKLAWME